MANQQPTTINSISADGFAQRIGQTPMFPRGWASETAKQSGGVFYALMNALGSQLSFAITELQYALNAQRIQTETSPELDLASVDFFGPGVLPRPTGMTDANYLILIQQNLLQTAATRSAVSNAVQRVTGQTPRIVEPWNPSDTGCWDTGVSYWDIDTIQNPWELCDPGSRYQGFITTILPPITGLNGNPLLTYNDGAFWDENFYTDTAEGVITGLSSLYAAINKVRPFGTIAWVRIIGTTPANENEIVFTTLIDYNGGLNPVYIGVALSGTDISVAQWAIRKLTYDVNGNIISIKWANGTATFTNTWSNRTSYSYS